jgi:uncharacterized protein
MKRILTETLLKWRYKKNRKPLILRGARQVGKSWVLKDFGRSFKNTHYINFERSSAYNDIFTDLDPLEIIRKIEIISKRKISIKDDLLIFDELQECARAITSLKYFCEELPELAVCSAGSHIGLALTTDSFPVGKVEQFTLYPMTFYEFLSEHHAHLIDSYNSFNISDLEHKLLWDVYLDYIFCGGMPEAVVNFKNELESINEVRNIHKNLIKAYCDDFSRYSGSQNGTHILATYMNIPSQLEASNDGAVSRFKFKGILPNRSKYSQFKGPIDWLTTIELVYCNKRVSKMEPPLQGYTKENMFKLFWHDIGLLHRELGIDYGQTISQDYGSYKGFIAENFVAQELKALGYDLQHWDPERNTAEIEFLLPNDDGIIPIEVKSGSKKRKHKSLLVFKDKFKPKLSIKLSGMNLRFEQDQINAPLYLSGRIKELIEHFKRNSKSTPKF